MWNTLADLLSTDAGIRLACALILAGWIVGVLTVITLGWPHLRAPSETSVLRRYWWVKEFPR